MDTVLIGKELRTRAQGPVIWGQNDCALLASDIWELVTGHDPMADLRGTYASRWGYLQLARAEGGLMAMARRRMVGAKAFDASGAGLLVEGRRQFFAVALNGVWVARKEGGGLCNVSAARILGAWSW